MTKFDPYRSLCSWLQIITLYVNNARRIISVVAIVSFQCRDTEALFRRERVKRCRNIEAGARRELEQLEWSEKLDDLRVPPASRLEALADDREGQHSIRINDHVRVCFVWTAQGAMNVAIVDHY